MAFSHEVYTLGGVGGGIYMDRYMDLVLSSLGDGIGVWCFFQMKIPLKGSVYRVHNNCGLLLNFDRKHDCLWEGERVLYAIL